MILSLRQIEDIGAAVIQDFNKFFYCGSNALRNNKVRATPIDQFAREYLGLSVRFARLSADGRICGLTSYADAEYIIEEMGVVRTIELKQNQILLDSSFLEAGKVKKLCGKRRFTLAHECAHQILFQMESEESQQKCRGFYSDRRSYSLRDLKSREDWNEWQADTLGAALLMPKMYIQKYFERYQQNRPLISYGGRYATRERLAITHLTSFFGGSRSALEIRLRGLGYLIVRPRYCYHDPCEFLG